MGEGEGNPNNTHGLERSPRKWSVFVDLKTHSGITQDTEKKTQKREPATSEITYKLAEFICGFDRKSWIISNNL